jgi:uncharacterized membrane protein HdeD (DUF308 family)
MQEAAMVQASPSYKAAARNGQRQISRGWFIALGVPVTALGVFAAFNLLMATFASVFMLGVFMLAAGFFQVAHGFALRSWGAFAFWTLSGLLYLLAGAAVFYDPLFAMRLATLWIAVMLWLSGVLRLWIGVRDGELAGAHFVAASGLVSLLAAVLIGFGWPQNSPWVLGLLLACDLLWQGLTLLFVGIALGDGRSP